MALPSNDTVISVVVLIYSRTPLMPVPSLRFQSDMTNYVMTLCHVIRLHDSFRMKRAPGFPLRLCPRANKNLHMPSSYAQGILLHNICPQGTPGFPPRLCPRANKNLHIPSSYAQGTLLHNFCPHLYPAYLYLPVLFVPLHVHT
ncbi:hypothetical protein T02_10441 [Trichinella nativa]|uniref:Uncharacterized protein n=1 Tax=Trichinella nativa TaxID=6335 RepID=A0A0V1KTE6_9BILA|nr:hypothetical protein T02_10441 [Trichinella nativa]